MATVDDFLKVLYSMYDVTLDETVLFRNDEKAIYLIETEEVFEMVYLHVAKQGDGIIFEVIWKEDKPIGADIDLSGMCLRLIQFIIE